MTITLFVLTLFKLNKNGIIQSNRGQVIKYKMYHRVVVTGIGTVNPLGLTATGSWNNLLSGHSGIRNILEMAEWKHLHQDIFKLPSHLSAPVPGIPYEPEMMKRMKRPRHFLFAEMAAVEALKDSKLTISDRVGVFFGCGMPGVSEIYDAARSEITKMSPYFIPAILGNSPAGHISRLFGLKGPINSPSAACATGTVAIGDAYKLLRCRDEFDCDAILAGACEAPLTPPSFAGFSRLRALSTWNSLPHEASRPFDTARNGFVLGEGAACLLLERLDSALKRGAPNIYAEIIGFGCSGDAYHSTAPDPSNSGAIKAIKAALNTQVRFNLVGVNAHATSTQLGDKIELDALEKGLIDDKRMAKNTENMSNISVISNKGAIGHLLGASGAVESIFTVLALKHRILPSNRNLANKIHTSSHFNLPTSNQILPYNHENSILKTSFGFGGVNAALHFKTFKTI